MYALISDKQLSFISATDCTEWSKRAVPRF